MLERIYVDNYRCLSNFELSLGKSTLLVGRNGCGKSSVWEVLAGLQDIVAHGRAVSEVFSEHSRTRWGSRSEQTFELTLTIEGMHYAYRAVVRHTTGGRGRTVLSEESLTGDGAMLYQRAPDRMVELFGDRPSGAPRTRIPFDDGRSFLSALQERPDNERVRRFRAFIEDMQLVGIVGSGFQAESRGEATRIERDARNFVSWLSTRVLDDPSIVERMRGDLQQAIPAFQALRFERVGSTSRELMVDIRPEGEVRSHGLSFGELSDGERVLLVAYGLLHGAPARGLLFLDEPDNFLALTEIQPWLGKLRQILQERDTQLLVASHQPETINYLAADDVVVLSRPGGGHVRTSGLEFDLAEGSTAAEWLASAERGT
jgi:predicted ATPase